MRPLVWAKSVLACSLGTPRRALTETLRVWCVAPPRLSSERDIESTILQGEKIRFAERFSQNGPQGGRRRVLRDISVVHFDTRVRLVPLAPATAQGREHGPGYVHGIVFQSPVGILMDVEEERLRCFAGFLHPHLSSHGRHSLCHVQSQCRGHAAPTCVCWQQHCLRVAAVYCAPIASDCAAICPIGTSGTVVAVINDMVAIGVGGFFFMRSRKTSPAGQNEFRNPMARTTAVDNAAHSNAGSSDA